MKSNVDIVIDELATGAKTTTQLAEALVRHGKMASPKIAYLAIQNARRLRGSQIVRVGHREFALIDRGWPTGIRKSGAYFELRGETRWRPTSCRTVEEAVALRAKMLAEGKL